MPYTYVLYKYYCPSKLRNEDGELIERRRDARVSGNGYGTSIGEYGYGQVVVRGGGEGRGGHGAPSHGGKNCDGYVETAAAAVHVGVTGIQRSEDLASIPATGRWRARVRHLLSPDLRAHPLGRREAQAVHVVVLAALLSRIQRPEEPDAIAARELRQC